MKHISKRQRFFVSLAICSFLGMFFGAEMQRLLLGIGIGIAVGAVLGLLLSLLPVPEEKKHDATQQKPGRSK